MTSYLIIDLVLVALGVLGSIAAYRAGYAAKRKDGADVELVLTPDEGLSNPQEKRRNVRIKTVVGYMRMTEAERDNHLTTARNNPKDTVVHRY
jgi:hypothetical protein